MVKRLSLRNLLIFTFLLYLPMIFLGYGSDVDSYRVLTAGRNFWQTADYVPSRRPVFIVHEMMTFLLDRVGGSILSNLGTLMMSLLVLYCFYQICREYQIPNTTLISLILILHPVYWVNSTCTMDYIWSMGFFMAGFYLQRQNKPIYAGIAFGLSMGSRLSSAIQVAGILLLFFLFEKKSRKAALVSGAIAALLTLLALVLPWDFMGWSPGFWQLSTGSQALWSLPLRTGRFFYKNLSFWGLPAALILVIIFYFLIKERKRFVEGKHAQITLLSVWVIFFNLVLFFLNPIEIEYLLPTLPFWLILFSIGLQNRQKLLFVLLLFVFLANFVNINIARPDTPSSASGASFGVWLEPGYTLADLKWRSKLLGCETNECYSSRIPPNTR